MRPLSLSLLAALLFAEPALAQAPGAADALWEEGRAALARKDLETACARFAASDKLEPSAGARANLGDCEEQRGRVASAWAAFRSALEKLPPGDDRRPVVEARIAALAKRLPRLVLRLAPGAPGETTVREGETVLGSAATWDVALPLDPGPHELVVLVHGRGPSGIEATLVEGKTVTLVVGAPEERRPPKVEPRAPPRVPPPTAQTASLGPWILGGVGVAGLVVGTATGAVVLTKKSAADAGCSNVTRTCTHDGKAAADAGRALGPMTTIGLVIGAAGVAGGAIWLGVRHSARASATGISVAPVVGGAAWSLEGSW